ncbi:MFS transporter, partial [Vibrio sp. 10N.222.55.E8]
VLDSNLGAGMIPYAAIVVPIIGLFFIAKANRNSEAGNEKPATVVN